MHSIEKRNPPLPPKKEGKQLFEFFALIENSKAPDIHKISLFIITYRITVRISECFSICVL